MRRNVIRAILATAAIVGLAAPAALARGLPKVPTFIGRLGHSQFQIKPSSIVVTQDGSAYFAGRKLIHHYSAPLNWTSWTATGGRGSGFYWLDNCRPSCPQGRFHQYPVKLSVWRPEHVGGHLIFTRMTVTYTGPLPPHTIPRTQVWKVRHMKGGIFFWANP